MESGKIKFVSLGKIWFLLFVSFVIIFSFIYPIDFHNLGGTHSWLSGSTLKFVNNWLEDGVWEDHFTCYESFDSIEFQTHEERIPYLSYPTGSTFVVYIAAKILGKDHVGIYFLKHFQILWYFAETILLSVFLYILLTDLHIYAENEKNIVVYFTTLFWVLQPVNVWYLANVYFADQAVILYVMAFLLLEYISSCRMPTGQGRIIYIFKGIIIYFGILTDYYFWVLIFIAFIMRFVRNIMIKMEFKKIIKDLLGYVCPSVLAVGTFIGQLSYTNNWKSILISRFAIRTVGELGKNAFLMLFENFYQTMADGSAVRGALLIFLEITIIIFLTCYLKKSGGWRALILRKEYAIFIVGFVSPVLQILILRNHSAAHEFSMIKVGWILDMSILVLTMIMQKLTERSELLICGRRINCYIWNYVISYILVLCVSGVPFSGRNFLDSRYLQVSYPLAQILYENSKYEEVYFSFTCEIPINPPQQLAVSEKRVYRIESIEEIDTMFQKLPTDAQQMLIIEKNIEGKDTVIYEMETMLTAENEIVYEDELYRILHFK